jgi:hypothetical protein
MQKTACYFTKGVMIWRQLNVTVCGWEHPHRIISLSATKPNPLCATAWPLMPPHIIKSSSPSGLNYHGGPLFIMNLSALGWELIRKVRDPCVTLFILARHPSETREPGATYPLQAMPAINRA